LVFFVQRPCKTSVCLSVHLYYVFLLSFSSPVVCLFSSVFLFTCLSVFRLSFCSPVVCLLFFRLSV
jgi:hypothetical protein